jgi:hypothetical protein
MDGAMKVTIGRNWHGQINSVRRLPPGSPIKEDRRDVWTALLIYLLARMK